MTPIEISSLRRDGGCQPRAELNEEVVHDYAEAMKAGVDFPPVKVFHDGTDCWLSDGYHRVKAAELLERGTIDADIILGTQRGAILYSCGANGAHGLRRTNEDKRRAVRRLLEDEEWSKESDTWIAKACGVSQPFVSSMRREGEAASDNGSKMRTVTRGDKTYQLNTAGIGRRRSPEEIERQKAKKFAEWAEAGTPLQRLFRAWLNATPEQQFEFFKTKWEHDHGPWKEWVIEEVRKTPRENCAEASKRNDEEDLETAKTEAEADTPETATEAEGNAPETANRDDPKSAEREALPADPDTTEKQVEDDDPETAAPQLAALVN